MHLREDRYSSIPISASYSRLRLFYFITNSIPPFHAAQFPSALLWYGWHTLIAFCSRLPHYCPAQFSTAHLGLDCSLYIEFCTPYPTPPPPLPIWHSSPSMGAPQSPLVLLSIDFALFNPHWCSADKIWRSSLPVGALQPIFGALFHSVLLQHLLCTSLFHTALPIWPSSFPWWLLPFFIRIIIAFQMPIQNCS